MMAVNLKELEELFPKFEKDFLALFKTTREYQCLRQNLKYEAEAAFHDLFVDFFLGSGEDRINAKKGHLHVYKPPEKVDTNFDIRKDFFGSFHRNCFPNLVKAVMYRVNNPKGGVREIPVSQCNTADREAYNNEEESMDIEHVEKMWVMERLDNLTDNFFRFLNTLEKQTFEVMVYESKTYRQLILDIGRTLKGDVMTEDKLRHVRNLLEYRYLCYLYVMKFLEPERVLKGLNLFDKINYAYFGVRKFEQLPDMKLIEKMAYGKLERIVKARKSIRREPWEVERQLEKVLAIYKHEREANNPKYIIKSKVDSSHKEYDHYVLYVNSSGWAYDQISKDSMDLFAEEKGA
jgi:hypothetical protein